MKQLRRTAPLATVSTALAVLGLAAGSLAARGIEDDPATVLADDLQMEVLLAEELPRPDRALQERIGKRLVTRPPLDEARVYIGLALDEKGNETEHLFATVPLAPDARSLDGGGRVVVAMQGEKLVHMTAVGSTSFDDDVAKRWSVFLARLQDAARFLDAEADPGAWKRQFERIETPRNAEDRRLAALVKQRQAMLENRQINGLFKRVVETRESVPGTWLDRSIANMKAVAGTSADLGTVLGEESVEPHRDAALALVEILTEIRTAFDESDFASLEPLAEEAGRRCDVCHVNPGQGEDPGWMSASRKERRAATSLPAGPLRVGYDVAPALGDDGATSQRIADALHAAVLLIQNSSAF